MIEMSCPRCGAGGRVPRERVNSRLVCRKCLQVFHLGPGNKAIVGEPPPQKDAPKVKEKVAGERTGLTLELGDFGEKLGKIKLPDPKILGAVAGVALVIAFFYWLFSKETIEQRAETLAQAIRTMDMDVTSAIALPGTEIEAMKWLGDVHKEYTDLKLNLGNIDPGVKIQAQPSSDGSTSQTLMVFSREGATSTGPMSVEQAASLEMKEGKKSLELVVFWAKDTWQAWRLDGKRTAENANASQ